MAAPFLFFYEKILAEIVGGVRIMIVSIRMKKTFLFIIIFMSLVIVSIFFIMHKFPARNIVIENVSEEKIFEHKEEPAAPNPDSIPAMSEKEFLGSDLKLERIVSKNKYYTRWFITYKSEGFKISGVMNVPLGKGPFPIIILNHGYIDPKVYRNGTGVSRELDFFAKNGYVVFQSDYRNHAQSDFDPNNEVRPRSGYVEDVLNGASALKKSDLEFLDKENFGMLGHSMGGGITLNILVTKPETAKAYALLSPINSDYKVNFDRWVKTEWPETAEQFYEVYGTYEEEPEVWESFSAKNYFERISAPIMLHHGTADTETPLEWSRELEKILKEKNKDISYFEYTNEGHVFAAKAEDLMLQRTLEFFDKNLKK